MMLVAAVRDLRADLGRRQAWCRWQQQQDLVTNAESLFEFGANSSCTDTAAVCIDRFSTPCGGYQEVKIGEKSGSSIIEPV